MLKVALIEFHTKGYYIGNCELNEKIEEAKRLYDGAILNKTIMFAHEKNIISDDEKDRLIELKNEFRNPYSHAQIAAIIKDVPSTFKGFMFKFDDVKEAIKNKKDISAKEEIISSYISAQYHQYDIA